MVIETSTAIGGHLKTLARCYFLLELRSVLSFRPAVRQTQLPKQIPRNESLQMTAADCEGRMEKARMDCKAIREGPVDDGG